MTAKLHRPTCAESDLSKYSTIFSSIISCITSSSSILERGATPDPFVLRYHPQWDARHKISCLLDDRTNNKTPAARMDSGNGKRCLAMKGRD